MNKTFIFFHFGSYLSYFPRRWPGPFYANRLCKFSFHMAVRSRTNAIERRRAPAVLLLGASRDVCRRKIDFAERSTITTQDTVLRCVWLYHASGPRHAERDFSFFTSFFAKFKNGGPARPARWRYVQCPVRYLLFPPALREDGTCVFCQWGSRHVRGNNGVVCLECISDYSRFDISNSCFPAISRPSGLILSATADVAGPPPGMRCDESAKVSVSQSHETVPNTASPETGLAMMDTTIHSF